MIISSISANVLLACARKYAREARERIASMRAKRAKVFLVYARSARKCFLYAREARESIAGLRACLAHPRNYLSLG